MLEVCKLLQVASAGCSRAVKLPRVTCGLPSSRGMAFGVVPLTDLLLILPSGGRPSAGKHAGSSTDTWL